jgi:raffinose/stachyose/melibiose transport system substrate-binding protein
MTIYADHNKEGWQAVVQAINADPSIGVKLSVDQIPGGDQGFNVIKLRYAADEIADFLESNNINEAKKAGALDKVVPLAGAWAANSDSGLLNSSSYSSNGKILAVPAGSVNLGGMLYNMKLFASLGIAVPEDAQGASRRPREDQGGRETT